MAIGQRASMISLVASSARVIDVMVKKRRHLGEAKKATAFEKVRQPRKVVKNTSLREPDKCNVLHVTREAFQKTGRGRRTDQIKPPTLTHT